MKAKVLVSFNDKNAKKIRYVGEVIEVTEERFEEILVSDENSPLIEKVEIKSRKTAKEDEK